MISQYHEYVGNVNFHNRVRQSYLGLEYILTKDWSKRANLNALTLRCQRSRYEDIEKEHYWKAAATPMSIAGGNTDSDGGDDHRSCSFHDNNIGGVKEGLLLLRQVAPGDDPLSALVQQSAAAATATNENRCGYKKSLFEGRAGGGAGAGAGARSNQEFGSSRSSSLVSDDDGDAVPLMSTSTTKGSCGWSEFYITRDLIDMIQKDLDRIPSDHCLTCHNNWRTHLEDTNDRCEGTRRRRRRGVGLNRRQRPDNVGAFATTPALNTRNQEEHHDKVAVRIKERAGRIMKILFLYATG
jgi:hypothetical protein